jgi:hypothetical protein
MRYVLLAALSAALPFCAAEVRASEPGVAIFSDVHVPKGETRRDDVVCIGGKAVIDGTVEGQVVVVGGSLEFSGEARNVVTVLSPAKFHPGARIRGDNVHILGEMEKSAGVEFDGEQVDVGSRLPHGVQRIFSRGLLGLFVLLRVIGLVVSCLVILLIALLIPDRIERMSEALHERWPSSLGFGLLACLGVVVIVVGLAVTIIGIPFAILVGVTAKILGLMGVTAILLLLGRKLGTEVGLLSDASALWTTVLVGFGVVALVRFIPVLGELVWFVLGIIGLGLVLVTKLGSAEAEAGAS